MTLLEAKQELGRKLDINVDDIDNNGLFTEADLEAWIQLGVLKAWDYKPWDFTEGSKTATTEDSENYDYPTDLQSGSAYLLRVNGKEFKKLLFQDYLKYFEDYPNGTDRFWTEQKRFIFINQNAYTVGDSFDVFGKLMPPQIDLDNDSDRLPFSPDTDNNEHSGNGAIVLLAYSEALSSEKLNNPAQSEIERGKAYQILDILWKPFEEARANLQSKNRPMFDVPNFFGPTRQSPSSIGNFNYLE